METVNIDRTTTAAVNGTSLSIKSASEWEDGTHKVSYWKPGMSEPQITEIEVKDNVVQDANFGGALMSQRTVTIASTTGWENVYQVESVALEEDGLVSVTATYYPCTDGGTADLYDALFATGKYAGKCGSSGQDFPS